MKLALLTDGKELLVAIQDLCRAEKVPFEDLAEKIGMTYQKLYHRLAGKCVELELIESIVEALKAKRGSRRVALINYTDLTIVTSGGLRITLYKGE